MAASDDAIVAMRWRPGHTYVTGTTSDRRCNDCAHRVALAPSSIRLRARHPEYLILCQDCALGSLAAGEVTDVGWVDDEDDAW